MLSFSRLNEQDKSLGRRLRKPNVFSFLEKKNQWYLNRSEQLCEEPLHQSLKVHSNLACDKPANPSNILPIVR